MPPVVQPSKILVVDDDQGLLLLMEDALRAAGYSVTTADSAAAAAIAFRRHAPDLILLDLNLKDARGQALIDGLRREGVLAPFVVVTGQGDEKVAVEVMKLGALDYVMKDTAIIDLLPEVVRRALAGLERDRVMAEAEMEHRRLEAQILEISENERRQFGADLHDGIGQQLTAVELMCVGLKDDVARLDGTLGGQVDRIGALLRQTIAQTRAMARGLAPLGEEPDALPVALIALAAQIDGLGRHRCRAHVMAADFPIERPMGVHLFRIAQEAANNAVKHSGATEITLWLEKKDDCIRLEIQDNGSGLAEGRPSGGLGTRLMSYRAGMIGATLTFRSRPGLGLTVLCVLPNKSR